MAAKYGVNVTINAQAARPIEIQSTTPIAIVGFEEVLKNGLHFFMTTDKAIEYLNKAYETKKSQS